MLQRGSDYLVELGDLSSEAFSSDLSSADRALLREVAAWSQAYLWDSHPALGRTGPVCP